MLAIRPQRGREQELGRVGEIPVERSGPTCCFTWIGGVDLRYGSTADQGRTGRKDSSSRLWRPARALGTHAKRGPSTGHSAVGLRQGGEMSPDAEATFHRASCTPGNQVVAASDGPPFRQERRPTRVAELPGPVAVCLPKQALCELGDRVLGGDRIVEHRRVQRAPPPPPLTAPPSHPRHGLPGPTQSKPRHPHRQWAGWYGSGSPRIITVSWPDSQASSIGRDEIAAAARRDDATLRS
jgi:hypothetical protein